MYDFGYLRRNKQPPHMPYGQVRASNRSAPQQPLILDSQLDFTVACQTGAFIFVAIFGHNRQLKLIEVDFAFNYVRVWLVKQRALVLQLEMVSLGFLFYFLICINIVRCDRSPNGTGRKTALLISQGLKVYIQRLR